MNQYRTYINDEPSISPGVVFGHFKACINPLSILLNDKKDGKVNKKYIREHKRREKRTGPVRGDTDSGASSPEGGWLE